MAADKYSGLDMRGTLEWYEKAEIRIPVLKGNFHFPFPVEKNNFLELSPDDLACLFYLFPENARDRSILRKVIGQPPTWFSKGPESKPVSTVDENNAISLTAIVPSYIDYTPWKDVPAADIWLHQLPHVKEPIKRIVASEGFVHELAHSIIQPALYVDDYNLRQPDGSIISGLEAVLTFAQMAEEHSPISHYSSAYRGKNGKFESEDPDYNVLTAISEEMCESIAAYILGFAYRGEKEGGKQPLADRPKIAAFLDVFLNSQLSKPF